MNDTIPAVVIVGRPNVGKSLLFNRLIGRKAALVHAQPGMTLDFLSEDLILPNGKLTHLVDTGGVMGEEDSWSAIVKKQMRLAIERADLLLMVTDARAGLLSGDKELLSFLRHCRSQTPRLLVVNKAEGLTSPMADFYALGENKILEVSAKRGSGLFDLVKAIEQLMKTAVVAANEEAALPVAIVGRPNVGKSTLINRLLGDERMVVSERSGTTRDAVRTQWHTKQGRFMLIDTAGMRRRRAEGFCEKLSVSAARSVLADADVACLVVDLEHGVTRQDKRIAGLIENAGCAIVLLANKADLLTVAAGRKKIKAMLNELPFSSTVRGLAISAVSEHGLPLTAILKEIKSAASAGQMTMPTPQLNKTLAKIIAAQSPPRVEGIVPKLRYAHQGGRRPLSVIIHGSAVSKIKDEYRRYLSTSFAREFSLVGAPLRVFLSAEENPYV